MPLLSLAERRAGTELRLGDRRRGLQADTDLRLPVRRGPGWSHL